MPIFFLSVWIFVSLGNFVVVVVVVVVMIVRCEMRGKVVYAG